MKKKSNKSVTKKSPKSALQTSQSKQFTISKNTSVSTKSKTIKIHPQPLDQETKRSFDIKAIQPFLPLVVFLQSFVATFGSLYYSTFGDPVANFQRGDFFPANMGFTPCLLCWFARILMYPLLIISYIAMVKKDKQFSDYVLPFATVGIFLELYHYSLQKFPGLLTTLECSATNPCNAMEVNYFGFITIPLLCLIAFSVIQIACVLNVWINKKTSTQ